ncbi:hypothetical protein ES754_10230 [Psychrobacter frigidicola]|uniref:Uncharacterized protein n=1 Tax=Psychrobacter frigidicola TaxID=45611 RepID=A0A5C7A223_9GAMM|nr:hypothetical protein [Psychrobacter frigidicola]TXD96508.1 hypothetical protein ES754_10230 [Psychrobacter frigidicola]
MLTIIVWAVGAGLLLINIMLRTRILRLEARLKELTNPQQHLAYLRKLPVKNDKIAAIKALRKKYPELSLVEANKLWQQR